MKLADALPILQGACGRPFRELFANHPEDLRTNKGHAGQLLLVYIGLKLDSALTDFEDGELKTNKAYPSGAPRETMFITQISRVIDTLVSSPYTEFENSNLKKKIENLVYLPVVKDSSNTGDWYFTNCIHIQMISGTSVFEKIKQDYNSICEGLKKHIETSSDGYIHTTNGTNGYIQIRSKDSTPYFPIYSKQYQRNISNKNHAFYFCKKFLLEAKEGLFKL
jgi:DNA mismatch repair protein MutH